MNGTELIAAERARQIAQEGWTPEHDDEHAGGQLAQAAACYAIFAALDNRNMCRYSGSDGYPQTHPVAGWPWERAWWKPSLGDAPEDRIRELAKAGALIAAEIDRQQRVTAAGEESATPCDAGVGK
jgi:hypothetical protein